LRSRSCKTEEGAGAMAKKCRAHRRETSENEQKNASDL